MTHSDDQGLVLPPAIAPEQIVIVPIWKSDKREEVMGYAREIQKALSEFRVELDDRDEKNPGFKFNEWELKGVPLRIEIGPRDLINESVICSRRDIEKNKFEIPFESIKETVGEQLKEIQVSMFEKSKEYREDNTVHVESMDELLSTLNEKQGFVSCYWSENSEDENKIKELTKATLRCYLFDSKEGFKSINQENIEGKLAIFAKAY